MALYEPDDHDPEAPSQEDIARFDHDDAVCPSCGTDVYDDAGVCPVCGEILSTSETSHKAIFMIAAGLALFGIVVVSLL